MLPLLLLLLQSLCTQFSLIGHSEHAYSRCEWVRVYLAPSVIIHSGNCYSTFLFDWKLYISWIVSDDIGVVLNCFVFHFVRLFSLYVFVRSSTHFVSCIKNQSNVEFFKWWWWRWRRWLVVFILVCWYLQEFETQEPSCLDTLCSMLQCVCVLLENMKCHNNSSSIILLMLCFCYSVFSLIFILLASGTWLSPA